ncbi:phospho-sugar mutase [Mycolicibacterium sp. BiH015]|uniref:phospho-sugar mutase n=1 Tax=Mycolicibacterium sp. BiH015 TaxID=3018808 RepID=UPI0022E535FF|nr:phospho-sugar mutase [Mycolicibacterium sp. BiH015]MDA2894633.1 phospho-sugar mutase [Mycolicibacterium sp. BiH015]
MATADVVQEWIAHDPDPRAAAELAACDAEELADRFSRPLTFGTAGLRGPLRAGPNGMNLAVVIRATWGVARVLADQGLRGSRVVVGYDARHRSAEFGHAAAEVFAAQRFSVTLMPGHVPTPAVAYAVRNTEAAAGVQITASHNPPTDNGYKVYFPGGMQIVSPTDRDIETAIAAAPPADEIPRTPVVASGSDHLRAYLERAASVRRTTGSARIALTPMHGVGGEFALDALALAGFDDVHVVQRQFAPDPDFPTIRFPNPEEPGASDQLLALAAQVDAEIAVALDPDADRCAIGVPTPTGWRMLTGDETGWLLGEYILSQVHEAAVVASTVVSSRMLAGIAAAHGARHVETLTGFKWLARADKGLDAPLVYAYEEAIGHCVDPAAVRDKDGISAAVLACDLVVALRHQGRTVLDALDDLARRHGVHMTAAVTRRVASPEDAAALMTRLRSHPPGHVAGFTVTATDLAPRTDAVILAGGDGATSLRVVVRPSGTEPKLKSYIEIRCSGDLEQARRGAAELLSRTELAVAGITQSGDNVGDLVETRVDRGSEQA